MSGSLRENVGKKDAKLHRSQGLVPCVIYGGKEQLHFVVEESQFKKVIFTPNVYFIELNIDGKKYEAALQDVQYHPVTDRILHVDFLELAPDKKVTMGIPVSITGNSVGVLKGGKLLKKIRKLKVKALPADFPDNITVNISKLDINDSIRVSDLSYENLEFLDPANAVIVGVRVTRVVVEEEEEGEKEEGAEEGEEGAEKTEEKETPAE